MSTEPRAEMPLPPLTTQAKNLAGAMLRVGCKMVTLQETTIEEEEQEIRRGICSICPAYRPSDDRCAKCGCFLFEKIPLLTERCPEGMWPGDELKESDDVEESEDK